MKIYKLTIDTDVNDGTGLDFISFVEDPATQQNFICFNAEKAPMAFDADKHMVKGVVMECDKPIYRYNEFLGEHYVMFDKLAIERMMLKLSKQNLINSVDKDHNMNAIEGVYMVKSYMIDRENGINPEEFSEVNDHSWIAEYKIENEQFWQEVKNGGKLNGFSISGVFEYIDSQLMSKQNNNQIKSTKMSLIEKLTEKVVSKFIKSSFASAQAEEATLIYDGELTEGTEVFVENENGEIIPAADGDYHIGEKIITIESGIVKAIIGGEEPKNEPAEEPAAEEDMAKKKKECMEEGGEPAEEPAAEPAEKDEKDLRIEELEGLLKDRDAIIEELNAKIAEMEKAAEEKDAKIAEMQAAADEFAKQNTPAYVVENNEAKTMSIAEAIAKARK